MAELRDSFNSKKAQWENEKNAINKVQSLRAEVETTKAEIEKATRNGDYAKAGQLQYGKLPDLQRQLEAEEKIAADKKEQSLLRDRVTAEEISCIVARCAPAPALQTRTAPLAAFCSLAPRALARPSWPKRWPRPCLTMKRTWFVSI